MANLASVWGTPEKEKLGVQYGKSTQSHNPLLLTNKIPGKVRLTYTHIMTLYLCNALEEGDLSDGIPLLGQHQVELVNLAIGLQDTAD